jgi:hypothetical protein
MFLLSAAVALLILAVAVGLLLSLLQELSHQAPTP